MIIITFVVFRLRFVRDLTAYLLTTDRVHAEEALESLRSQGIYRPVEIIRNVRPLRSAHLPTLECETPYCLVLDDDTVLRPGMVPRMLDIFRRLREVTPAGFKLKGRVFAEVRDAWDSAGLKLFYTPHLKRVGWPDAPHVSFAQVQAAQRLGLKVLKCDIDCGVQKRGTNLDVYKKFLWVHLRQRAGQLAGETRDQLAARAATGPDWLWFAVLGMVDGAAVGNVSTSKHEDFAGPIGRALNFDQLRGEDVRRLLAERGLIQIAPAPPHAAVLRAAAEGA